MRAAAHIFTCEWRHSVTVVSAPRSGVEKYERIEGLLGLLLQAASKLVLLLTFSVILAREFLFFA